MPYMELRNYKSENDNITTEQRDNILRLVRDYLARGQEIDGTFEFRLLNRGSKFDFCEYDYILVIDMGHSEQRELQKEEIAKNISRELSTILDTGLLAVRLRLQNAAFVPNEF